MKHKTKQKGFTLIELLVVMSIIALLLSILMPALGRARAEAMLTKDQTQVKAIFSGFSFWTPSHDGKYPTPGLEARAEGSSGTLIKGRGPENLSKNDHASLLSMCVMQNLFSTDVLYAPTEQGENVYPMEAYDYNSYEPMPVGGAWELWDQTFVNDLGDEELGSNNSYGIMPVTGLRKQRNWCVSTHSPTTFAIVGTRGPTNDPNVDSQWETHLKTSATNLFHGIDSDWKGIVQFGDGHGTILETFYPISSTYIDTNELAVSDNLFLEDPDQQLNDDYMPGGLATGQGADILLTHVVETTDGGKGGKCGAFIHD